jgi:hypothetical protein
LGCRRKHPDSTMASSTSRPAAALQPGWCESPACLVRRAPPRAYVTASSIA